MAINAITMNRLVMMVPSSINGIDFFEHDYAHEAFQSAISLTRIKYVRFWHKADIPAYPD